MNILKSPVNPEKALYNFKVTLPGGRLAFVSYTYDQLKSCKSKYYDERGTEVFLRDLSLENCRVYSRSLIRCRLEFNHFAGFNDTNYNPYIFNSAPFFDSFPILKRKIQTERGVLTKSCEYYEEILEEMSKSIPLIADAIKLAPDSIVLRLNLYDLCEEDEYFELPKDFCDESLWDSYKEKEEFYLLKSSGETYHFSAEQHWDEYREDARRFLIRNGFSVEYIGFEEQYEEASLTLWDVDRVLKFNGHQIYSALLHDIGLFEAYEFGILWNDGSGISSACDIGLLLERSGCSNVILLNAVETLKRIGRRDGFEISFNEDFVKLLLGDEEECDCN